MKKLIWAGVIAGVGALAYLMPWTARSDDGNNVNLTYSPNFFSRPAARAMLIQVGDFYNAHFSRTYSGKNGEVVDIDCADYMNDGDLDAVSIRLYPTDDSNKKYYFQEWLRENNFLPSGSFQGTTLSEEEAIEICPDLLTLRENHIDPEALGIRVREKAGELTKAYKDPRFGFGKPSGASVNGIPAERVPGWHVIELPNPFPFPNPPTATEEGK